MAQRRPIATHPAFVPLLALWFAALLGLGVAVLPAATLERALAGAGFDVPGPLTFGARSLAGGAAAVTGALLGLAFALPLARRSRSDPRPIYADTGHSSDCPVAEEPVRRPLRVREELAEGLSEHAGREALGASATENIAEPGPSVAENDEGFMILTPQPVHPPRPAPDLDSLLEQFDTAIAAFRAEDEPRSPANNSADPVRAFVARQTGSPAPSPLGGRMPDHQAELRSALDKLARAQRED